MRALAVVILCSILTVLLWAWPNQPQAANVAMAPGGSNARFNSVSYAPYRAWQSPLSKTYPDGAEVAQDLKLIATKADGIRTYSAIEGDYDIGALAKQAGLKVWLGIWLSSNPADNAKEMAAGIAEANKHPHTITRVIVGNEVLLRRDLSVGDLEHDIDYVRARVKQPVAYADVTDFWLQFPQVASHVDIVMVHFLPYWENHPLGVDAAIANIRTVIEQVKAKFPGKTISIGETGWPSQGRWREGAVPSRVNEAVFIRKFVALATAEHVDYNLIEAFDQNWKYEDEGIAGANWGIWTAWRQPKFPLAGPVVEHPGWRWDAAGAVLAGIVLTLLGRVGTFGPRVVLGFALANAFVYAWAFTVPDLYDTELRLFALVNLPAQAVLAILAMRGGGAVVPGAEVLRRLRRPCFWPGLGGFEFLFLAAAAITEATLVFDGRYRIAPMMVFAVPAVAAASRLLRRALPDAIGWEEGLAAGALVLGAIVSLVIEGPENYQFLRWDLAAVIMASPYLAAALRNAGGPGSLSRHRR